MQIAHCEHDLVSHDITTHEYHCTRCGEFISYAFNPEHMTSEHRPFLVTAKIMDSNRLMGFVAQDADGDKIRFSTQQVLTKLINGYDFNIQANGEGPIARLTVAEELRKDGCFYYFKTIGDKTKLNNFGKLPVIKYNSNVRKIKLYKDG